MATFDSVDAYMASLSPDAREKLEAVRDAVRRVAPDATDRISYDIPAASVAGKDVIGYAAWRRHISIYPIPRGDAALQADMQPYIAGRGTLRFPLGEPLPGELIERVVSALVAERTAGH